jgi:nicotinamide phosphoribosyltransferase
MQNGLRARLGPAKNETPNPHPKFHDNIMLLADSYKATHWKQYPQNTERIYSYMECRGCNNKMELVKGGQKLEWDHSVFFGLRYVMKRYLVGVQVTKQKIAEAEAFYNAHFPGRKLFNKTGWEHIENNHKGKLPVVIKALPEGSVVNLSTPLLTVENTCSECVWLPNFLETILLQLWHPISVASNSMYQRIAIQSYLETFGLNETDADKHATHALHDFGFRGVSSVESAAIGGAAHLLNFNGSDTVAAIRLCMEYYGASQVSTTGTSIPASEHSTITSWRTGDADNEVQAMKNMIDQYNDGIVACVSDSYDIFKACWWLWGHELKEHIRRTYVNSRGKFKLVVRPDSGDPPEICLSVLHLLWEAYKKTDGTSDSVSGDEFYNDTFSSTLVHNGVKFNVLPKCIGVIQGDGVDYKTIPVILETVVRGGFVPQSVTFGSGGALLQKLNRDTFQMAFKCSAIYKYKQKSSNCTIESTDGTWHPVFKDPVTAKSKKSKRGLFKVSKDGYKYTTYTSFTDDNSMNSTFPGIGVDDLVVAFKDGSMDDTYVSDSFDKIKSSVRRYVGIQSHQLKIDTTRVADTDISAYIENAKKNFETTTSNTYPTTDVMTPVSSEATLGSPTVSPKTKPRKPQSLGDRPPWRR